MASAGSAALPFPVSGVNKTLFSATMFLRQDIVFSLILVPIKSGLRGFCLLIFVNILSDYRQKNPLKYYILPVCNSIYE